MRHDSSGYKILVRSYQRVYRRMWWLNSLAQNGIKPLMKVLAQAQSAVALAKRELGPVASGRVAPLAEMWGLETLEKRVLMSITPSVVGQTVTFDQTSGTNNLYLRGNGGLLEYSTDDSVWTNN